MSFFFFKILWKISTSIELFSHSFLNITSFKNYYLYHTTPCIIQIHTTFYTLHAMPQGPDERRIIPRQLAATNQKHEVHANRRSMPLCSCRSHFPVIDSHRFTLIYCLVLQSQVLNHLSDLQLRELVNFGASLSGPDVFDIRSMERSIAEFHRESGIRKGCDAMPV